MLKECNVWTFLTATVLMGGFVYIYHESIDNGKYLTMEYNKNTGEYKFYVNDEKAKEIGV